MYIIMILVCIPVKVDPKLPFTVPFIKNSFAIFFTEYSSENLRLCLIIVLAHTLLAPELVMRTNGVQIMSVCDNLMADMRTEGIVMLTKVVENYIRASPTLGCETVKPVLPRIFQ